MSYPRKEEFPRIRNPTPTGMMKTCDYFLFASGFQSTPSLAHLGITASAPVAVLLTLLSLASIVLHDVAIDLVFRATTVGVDVDELAVAINSTVIAHLSARNLKIRDAGGDGSNGLSNVLLIALLVLFIAFLLLVIIVLSCCRCRRRTCFKLCCQFFCFLDSHRCCRQRTRRKRKDKKQKDLEMQPVISENDSNESEAENTSDEEQ